MKQVDLLQLWTFWLGFVVSLAMYYSLTLTEPLLRGVLGAVTVIVLGSEAWLAWTTKRSFLRLRGFILGGLYIWLLLKPLVFGALHNNYYLKLTIKDLWLALIASFLFAACMWTGYVLRGAKPGVIGRNLGEIIPTISPTAAFWLCVFCLMPELINRWVHTDWTRVQSLPLALIGQDAAARFGIGRFGDERSFWRPATYLFELLAITAAVAFLKCKGRLDLRIIIVGIYIFNLVSLSMGWSRYKFGIAFFSPILIFFCVYPTSKHLRLYMTTACAFAVYVVVAALMSEGRAGAWFRQGATEVLSANRQGRAEKTVEDTFSVLANAIKVVPAIEPYLPFYDVYYHVVINPIPRAIWKQKPVIDQEYLGRRRPYYCTLTAAGDAYLCGGYWHLVVVSLAIGWVSRSLDNFFRPWSPMEPEFAFVYLAIAAVMFIMVRSILSVMTFGFPMIALLSVLAVVRFIRGRKSRVKGQGRRVIGNAWGRRGTTRVGLARRKGYGV